MNVDEIATAWNFLRISCSVMLASSVLHAGTLDKTAHEFVFGGPDNSEFLLDGQPFQIRSGEIHPDRIPPEYWQHRIRMAKAMGLNTSLS